MAVRIGLCVAAAAALVLVLCAATAEAIAMRMPKALHKLRARRHAHTRMGVTAGAGVSVGVRLVKAEVLGIGQKLKLDLTLRDSGATTLNDAVFGAAAEWRDNVQFVTAVAGASAAADPNRVYYDAQFSFQNDLKHIEVWRKNGRNKPCAVNTGRNVQWNGNIPVLEAGGCYKVVFEPISAVYVKLRNAANAERPGGAGLSCGVKARTWHQRILPFCFGALTARGGPMAGARYPLALGDVVGGIPGGGAGAALNGGASNQVTLTVAEPTPVTLHAYAHDGHSQATVWIARAAAARFDNAFVVALNAMRDGAWPALLSANAAAVNGGNARLVHNGNNVPWNTPAHPNELNRAQTYVVRYVEVDAVLPATLSHMDQTVEAYSPEHLHHHAYGPVENQRHRGLFYVNWRDPGFPAVAPAQAIIPGVARKAPPLTYRHDPNNARSVADPRAEALALLDVQIDAAATQTPDGLWDRLLGDPAGGHPERGYDENSPARELHRALERARGRVANHFGYGYHVLDIAYSVGQQNLMTRRVGWMCATANIDQLSVAEYNAWRLAVTGTAPGVLPAVAPNPNALPPALGTGSRTTGVLIHTEQLCMEQLREFVLALELPANAPGVTAKVTDMKARWQIDYVPDNLPDFRCEWMFQYVRYVTSLGHFRKAPYTEAVRVLSGAADPNTGMYAGATRNSANAHILQEIANNHYDAANVALANGVITWPILAVSWTYTRHDDPNLNVNPTRNHMYFRDHAHPAEGALLTTWRNNRRAALRGAPPNNALLPQLNDAEYPLLGGPNGATFATAVPSLATEVLWSDAAHNHAGRYGDGNDKHMGSPDPRANALAPVPLHAWPWYPDLQ